MPFTSSLYPTERLVLRAGSGHLSCGLDSAKGWPVRGDRGPGQQSLPLLTRPSQCHLTQREDEGRNE